MNPKNYIISQRLTYLTLGGTIGFLFGITQEPYGILFIIGFIVLGLILSWWFGR